MTLNSRLKRGRWLLVPALLSLSLGTQAQLPGVLGDLLKQLPGNTQKPQPDAKAEQAAEAAAAAAANAAPLLVASRDGNSMRKLFEKGTVSGADLLPELRGVRKVAGSRGGADMSTLLSGTVGDNSSGAAAGILGGLFQGGASGVAMKGMMATFESLLGQLVLNVATTHLRQHLDGMIGDTATLEAEKIQLPSANNLTPQQMQRAVNLAAILVATRLTGKILKQAEADMAGLEQEYAELITRREQAATLLQQALTGGLPDSARNLFAPEEVEFLRQLKTEEFVHHQGAQELALRLVSVTDAASFKDYRAKSQAATKRQTAVLRTLAGVGAFGGVLAWSGRELTKLGKTQPIAEMLAFGPLAVGFFTEVPPIITSLAKIAAEGANQLVKTGTAFRVTVDGKTEEVRSASAVFDLIAKNGAMPPLQEAMFRDSARGLMWAVHQCDPVTSAQMLDAATSAEQRKALATEKRLQNADGFSFTDAFTPGEGAQEELAKALLDTDYRPRLQRDKAFGELQYAVAGREGDGGAKPGFLSWNNDQLLRLVFVSREGRPAQFALLETGNVKVTPVPSMQSLYAYDLLSNACRSRFTPQASPGATPARAPQASPAPAQSKPPAQGNRPVKKP